MTHGRGSTKAQRPISDELRPSESGTGWDCVAEASRDSFPASDPPAWIGRRPDLPPLPHAGRRTLPGEASRVDVEDDAVVVDAALVADLLDLPVADVQQHMREGRITTICEKGLGEHRGRMRLNFFYGSRRASVSIDQSGRVLDRAVDAAGDPPDAARPSGV